MVRLWTHRKRSQGARLPVFDILQSHSHAILPTHSVGGYICWLGSFGCKQWRLVLTNLIKRGINGWMWGGSWNGRKGWRTRLRKDKTWVRCGGPGSKNWGISSSHMFWDNDPVILISCVTQDKISQMRTLSLRFTPWPEYLDHVLHWGNNVGVESSRGNWSPGIE